MNREPAVAGQFYPATSEAVAEQLDQFISVSSTPRQAVAVVVPHAGWVYSGRTAGMVYGSIVVPDHVILVGPNHFAEGTAPYALYDAGRWELPTGTVPIDEALAAMLFDNCDLLAEDPRAHRREHALEVQVPMLQRRNNRVKIVPLLIAGGVTRRGLGPLRELGACIASTVREFGQPVLLVASTDLNHYEDQQTSNIKDKLVLDAVLGLDEEGLAQRVEEVDVSMCGVAATCVVLYAAKKLGAKRAELIDYRTSGDVTGDYSSVVGYGGVVIE